MFRMGLLTSTAMTAVALLLSGADAAQAQTGMHVASRDPNTRFLCTYGYKVFYYMHAISGVHFKEWRHYAVPIWGKGASVTGIITTDSPSAGHSSFNVGIYQNASGAPGNLLASGNGKAKGSCRLTTVAIPNTFLTAGKKYWIVEEVEVSQRNHGHAVSWGYKPNAKHNALAQYGSSSSSGTPHSAFVTKWHPVSGPAPFAKVQ